MPILDRLTEPDDEHGDKKKPEPVAPKIVRGRDGYASYSIEALKERIEGQVRAELEDRSDILLEARSDLARRQLVWEAGEYVLAAESIALTREDKAGLLESVYRELFSFGPLDAFLRDEAVTELSIDGHDRVSVRVGAGTLQGVPSPFADDQHLARICERVITAAGGQLHESEPFLELGLTLLGRPARVSLVGPPLSPVIHLAMRLHPAAAVSLDRLVDDGMLSTTDRQVLAALAGTSYGFMVVGDAGSGKTTLIEALLPALTAGRRSLVIERAHELRVPDGVRQLAAVPAQPQEEAVTFESQVLAALSQAPDFLLLDELRGDESVPVWAALQAASVRSVFAFRTSTEPLRLRNAFNMMIRKGQPTIKQQLIDDTLLQSLPFVVGLHAMVDGLRVKAISEWLTGSEPGSLELNPVVRGGAMVGRSERLDVGNSSTNRPD